MFRLCKKSATLSPPEVELLLKSVDTAWKAFIIAVQRAEAVEGVSVQLKRQYNGLGDPGPHDADMHKVVVGYYTRLR